MPLFVTSICSKALGCHGILAALLCQIVTQVHKKRSIELISQRFILPSFIHWFNSSGVMILEAEKGILCLDAQR